MSSLDHRRSITGAFGLEGASWARGKYGSGLQFDGENDCLSIANAAELNFTEEFTLEAWVRPDDEENRAIISQEDNAAAEGEEPFAYSLLVGGEAGGPRGWLRRGGEEGHEGVAGGDPLPPNAWSHVALTDDGARLRVYLDGELVGTDPAIPLTTGAGPLSIGCLAEYGNYFKGRLDEVRVYNRALSGNEIEDTTSPWFSPFFSASAWTNDGATTVLLNGAADSGSPGGIAPFYRYRYSIDHGPLSEWILSQTNSFSIATPEEDEVITLKVYAEDAAGNRTDTESAELTATPEASFEPTETEIDEAEKDSERLGNSDNRFARLVAIPKGSFNSLNLLAGDGARTPLPYECKPHANDPHISTSLKPQLKIKATGFAWCGAKLAGATITLRVELLQQGSGGWYVTEPSRRFENRTHGSATANFPPRSGDRLSTGPILCAGNHRTGWAARSRQ
jgi:hypothetical protein